MQIDQQQDARSLINVYEASQIMERRTSRRASDRAAQAIAVEMSAGTAEVSVGFSERRLSGMGAGGVSRSSLPPAAEDIRQRARDLVKLAELAWRYRAVGDRTSRRGSR